ncbi:MAG: Na/Pi cotransporter family protein [Vicinamibacterales bacterium]
MLNSVFANVIAGLGLFFSGIRLIDAHLRQATGRRLRTAVGHLTQSPWIAAGVGLVTGALVQTTSGILFILVSLVASGLTTVRRVLPIVTWANVGCCALIFVAVLDLRLGILYLLGLAGAAFAFDRSHRSHALGAMFGVGMLFYGIELMKAGAAPLNQMPWFARMLDGGHDSLLLAFASGALASFITQSSTAVAILAIGLAQMGLLGPFATMMALYGANVGSTFARMLLSTGLRGSVRQIAAYQDLFKITGAVLFVSLLYAEAMGRIPLVLALVSTISGHVDRQMALVFLLFNLGTAVLFSAARSPLIRLLEWWLPADAQEDLSMPRFLYGESLEEPATALDLVDREQIRLAECLRRYAEEIRRGPAAAERVLLLHKPFATLALHIEHFEHALVDRALGPLETERLTILQNRLSLIVYLEDSLRGMATTTDAVTADSRLGSLVSSLVEALDFVLLTLIDAMKSGDRDQIELLANLTEDRGPLMEKIRQRYLEDAGMNPADRGVLLQVTSVFERVVWMAQRLARLLDRNSRPSLAAAL